jgi:hypothetical protein
MPHGCKHSKEYWHLYKKWQATAHRVIPFPAHKLSLFLLKLYLVIYIFLLEFVKFGLYFLHLTHTLAVFNIKGHEQKTDEYSKNYYGPAMGTYERLDKVKYTGK